MSQQSSSDKRFLDIIQGSWIKFYISDTRITLLLLGELFSALQANDPDTLKRRLSGGSSLTSKSLLSKIYC
jgi:hypothetical protein|tara:strand:- start:82 stop:294 length:213 start_codon:yes stop_codon:yes gene_type:complete